MGRYCDRLPFALGLPFVFRFWHLCNVVLRALAHRDDRYHRPNLIFGLALGLLQEIPKRIDKDVVAGGSLILFGPADFADPAYGRPVFGCEADRGPMSIIRDMLLSRAHGSDCC